MRTDSVCRCAGARRKALDYIPVLTASAFFLLVASAVTLATPAWAAESPPASAGAVKPNILVINGDDIGEIGRAHV